MILLILAEIASCSHRLKCQDCGSIDYILQDVNKICTSCGTILEISSDGSMQFTESGERRTTVTISEYTPEASRQIMVAKNTTGKFYAYHCAIPYSEQNLLHKFREIDTKCNQHLSLEVITLIKQLIAEISTVKIFRGQNLKNIYHGATFVACKILYKAIIVQDIINIFNCTSKQCTEGVKLVYNICRKYQILSNVHIKLTSRKQYILKFLKKLDKLNMVDIINEQHTLLKVFNKIPVDKCSLTYVLSLIFVMLIKPNTAGTKIQVKKYNNELIKKISLISGTSIGSIKTTSQILIERLAPFHR